MRQSILTLVVASLLSAATAMAADGLRIVVEDWQRYPEGKLTLGRTWKRYPYSTGPRHPPFITSDGSEGKVLMIRTEDDVVTIGKSVAIDVTKTPLLAWRWKVLTMPTGGDARNPLKDDQVLRLLLLFEPAGFGKAIGYIWDSTAPAGTVLPKRTMPRIDRRLVVVRTGSEAVGAWHEETRNVLTDYVRLFGGKPSLVSHVGIESHSNDTHSGTHALFGRISVMSATE